MSRVLERLEHLTAHGEHDAAERLWMEALRRNDIHMATRAARGLRDSRRLHAIALDAWLTDKTAAAVAALNALGLEINATTLAHLDALLTEANANRRTSILQRPHLLEVLVQAHTSSRGASHAVADTTPAGTTEITAASFDDALLLLIEDAGGGYTYILPPEPLFDHETADVQAWLDELSQNSRERLIRIPRTPLTPTATEPTEQSHGNPRLDAALQALTRFDPEDELWGQGDPGYLYDVGWTQLQRLIFDDDWDPEDPQVIHAIEALQGFLAEWPHQHLTTFISDEEHGHSANAHALIQRLARALIIWDDGVWVDEEEDREDVVLSGDAHAGIRHLMVSRGDEALCAAIEDASFLPHLEGLEWGEPDNDFYRGDADWNEELSEEESRERLPRLEHETRVLTEVVRRASHLRDLEIAGVPLGCAFFRALAHATGLRSLTFTGLLVIEDDVPDTLITEAFSSLAGLESLELLGCREIRPAFLDALARAQLPALRSFHASELGGYDVDDAERARIDASLARFLCSPAVSGLRSLELFERGCDDIGATLAKAALTHLQKLTLSGMTLEASDLQAIAESESAAHLETLSLEHTGIGDAGFGALSASPYLTRLRSLNVEACGLTLASIKALTSSEHLNALTHLSLAYNDGLKLSAAKALSQWPRLAQLQRLDVSDCKLTRKGRMMLAESPHLLGDLAGVPERETRLPHWRRMA